MSPRRRGRPPRSDETATARVTLRLTPKELRAYRSAAVGKSLSSWIRTQLNKHLADAED